MIEVVDFDDHNKVVPHGATGRVKLYTMTKELFVRARVTSSRLKENGVEPGERERAWTQPVLPVR